MANLIDFILDLFRDPAKGQQFVNNPEQSLQNAGLQGVTGEQMQAVCAAAAPAVALGNGDPVAGVQQAVADQHGIPFDPPVIDPIQPVAQVLQPAAVQVASPNTIVNDNHSVNLSFGDLTLGNKTTAVGDGAVAVGGDNNHSPIVSGDGAVLGNNNTVNNGHIDTGAGSNVTIGNGDHVSNNSQNANGGDVISGNHAPVVKGVDLSGNNGGAGGNLSIDSHDNNGTIDNSQHIDNSIHDDHSNHVVDNSNHVVDNSNHVVDNSIHQHVVQQQAESHFGLFG